MGIYQIIIIVLYAMGLGVALIKDGEEYKKKYNFFNSLLFFCFIMFCLYKGGFFNQ